MKKKIQPDDERFDQGIDELIYKNSSVTPEDLSFSTNLATNLSMFLHFRVFCDAYETSFAEIGQLVAGIKAVRF